MRQLPTASCFSLYGPQVRLWGVRTQPGRHKAGVSGGALAEPNGCPLPLRAGSLGEWPLPTEGLRGLNGCSAAGSPGMGITHTEGWSSIKIPPNAPQEASARQEKGQGFLHLWEPGDVCLLSPTVTATPAPFCCATRRTDPTGAGGGAHVRMPFSPYEKHLTLKSSLAF